MFDARSRSWSKPVTTGQPPSPRTLHFAAVVGSRLFVFGGGGIAMTPVDDTRLHVLDLETCTTQNSLLAHFNAAGFLCTLWLPIDSSCSVWCSVAMPHSDQGLPTGSRALVLPKYHRRCPATTAWPHNMRRWNKDLRLRWHGGHRFSWGPLDARYRCDGMVRSPSTAGALDLMKASQGVRIHVPVHAGSEEGGGEVFVARLSPHAPAILPRRSQPPTSGLPPSARSAHAVAVLGDSFFISGGLGLSGTEGQPPLAFDDLIEFDTAAMRWKALVADTAPINPR